ncbi:flagellar hook protein FlgE [Candidatus Njordibacter sp. Uisw_056]|jgi:flagellar hook protein FlgE|uniref:flagellar hook protein FlgE n=1 Tax=Candidatus Njordibacter sp. Uisw_056 TaxID=3230973 RepID=UPI003D38A7D8
MSFYTSLTGLNSAQADLGVTSNNIANVGTVGFKKSRADFGDLFSSTSGAIGQGAHLKNVNQQFSQGSIEMSGNALDLAISGEGFFAVRPDLSATETVYTRAGAFSINNDNYVVDSSGQYLQAFPVSEDGSVIATGLTSAKSLQLTSAGGLPKVTSKIELGLNLPSDAAIKPTASFSPSDSNTFNSSTQMTAYDSLGNPHVATVYFLKTSNPTPAVPTNTWDTKLYIDGTVIAPTNAADSVLTFDQDGKLTAPIAAITYDPATLITGAIPLSLSIDYGSLSSQYSAPFSVMSLSQDGHPRGELSGMDVDSSGVVRANYTNGTQLALGKLMLANFDNPNGLKQIGNASFEATNASGLVDLGEAGFGGFGDIRGGALEGSNVDLTEQLVKLISAQRNFQANAKALDTSGTLMQTIMGIMN